MTSPEIVGISINEIRTMSVIVMLSNFFIQVNSSIVLSGIFTIAGMVEFQVEDPVETGLWGVCIYLVMPVEDILQCERALPVERDESELDSEFCIGEMI